jgi:phage terminase large subunit-like protein
VCQEESREQGNRRREVRNEIRQRFCWSDEEEELMIHDSGITETKRQAA